MPTSTFVPAPNEIQARSNGHSAVTSNAVSPGSPNAAFAKAVRFVATAASAATRTVKPSPSFSTCAGRTADGAVPPTQFAPSLHAPVTGRFQSANEPTCVTVNVPVPSIQVASRMSPDAFWE